mmetsp:Transcript_17260/g.36415  ORF Transcript_17260/g.36415 Transcript_17260/m.36415 type:complete len:136 (-) Transcript_17260:794-1201(-)
MGSFVSLSTFTNKGDGVGAFVGLEMGDGVGALVGLVKGDVVGALVVSVVMIEAVSDPSPHKPPTPLCYKTSLALKQAGDLTKMDQTWKMKMHTKRVHKFHHTTHLHLPYIFQGLLSVYGPLYSKLMTLFCTHQEY